MIAILVPETRRCLFASLLFRCWMGLQSLRILATAFCLLLSAFCSLPTARSQELPLAPASPLPDERYKADILVIVAHPDDETMVTGYLAHAIFDKHKRVAVIYGTRGDGGGNAVGYEQGAALGAEREIEARRALAHFDVMNVWFLNGPDTPGQDVLRSLETWHHGEALADTVRLVRLTRPEIIFTWLPAYVAGENHDDHQAAGVIATEAFDMAGDPTVFAEQVAAPRNRASISNLTEGLQPWQPQKIYYFSDASHMDFLNGQGPTFDNNAVSPSRHVPYYRLAAEEMAFHLTQGDTGQMAKQALAKGDFRYFQDPIRLIFGKSLVKCSPAGDIFEGLGSKSAPFSRMQGYHSIPRPGLSLELGGPWDFCRKFWAAHNIQHLAELLKTPEVAITRGETLHVPLLLQNNTNAPQELTVTITMPAGWKEYSGTARYPVRAHETYPVQTYLGSPTSPAQEWQEVTFKAESGGKAVGSITLRVQFSSGGLPQ